MTAKINQKYVYGIHSVTSVIKSDNESINSCSSTSSYSDEENETVSNSDSSDNSSMQSDDVINININEFPIQLIALERCNNTLDSLMNEENISDEELSCIVVQILMMLISVNIKTSYYLQDTLVYRCVSTIKVMLGLTT